MGGPRETALFRGLSRDPGPFCLVLCHFLGVILICRIRAAHSTWFCSFLPMGKGSGRWEFTSAHLLRRCGPCDHLPAWQTVPAKPQRLHLWRAGSGQ